MKIATVEYLENNENENRINRIKLKQCSQRIEYACIMYVIHVFIMHKLVILYLHVMIYTVIYLCYTYVIKYISMYYGIYNK